MGGCDCGGGVVRKRCVFSMVAATTTTQVDSSKFGMEIQPCFVVFIQHYLPCICCINPAMHARSYVISPLSAIEPSNKPKTNNIFYPSLNIHNR